MIQPINLHITSIKEINLLLTMGYKLNLPVVEAVDFMKNNFANLDLGLLAHISEEALAKLNTQCNMVRSIIMEAGEEQEFILVLSKQSILFIIVSFQMAMHFQLQNGRHCHL